MSSLRKVGNYCDDSSRLSKILGENSFYYIALFVLVITFLSLLAVTHEA